MPVFDGTEKIIGRGAQAVVYLWQEDAYKVYPDQYPKEWIEHELQVQEEICKTGLPVVRYEKTVDPCIIKMGYINGITLADRIRRDNYNYGVEDMIELQKTILQIEDLKLPDMIGYAVHDLNNMTICQVRKERALAYLAAVPVKRNLLHFDFHFLNILYVPDQYYVIDWINARLGHPVFDFARSYVILNEFTYCLASKYLALITKDKDLDLADIKEAIYVEAVLRLRERTSEATVTLIQKLEDEFQIND